MDRFSRPLWSIRLVLYKNEADYLDCHIMYLKYMNEHEVMNEQCSVFLFSFLIFFKSSQSELKSSSSCASEAAASQQPQLVSEQ